MKDVRIGGVPEHFNLAWYLTLRDGSYKKEGIHLRWTDFHGGTGEMCSALRNEEVDLAVVLTEGIIKDIIAGNPSKIVQTFVKSPLVWGVHVAHQSAFESMDDLKGKKAAISRYGSGSHLMAYINAQNNNWDLNNDLNFEVIENLQGAVDGLTNGRADYFLWEKFTTKPLVDNQIFKRIGECPTPWPCFVIAARESFINEEPEALATILEIINKTTAEFRFIPSIDRTISNRYGQSLEDVRAWINITEWTDEVIDQQTISSIQSHLASIDIIPRTVAYNELVKIL